MFLAMDKYGYVRVEGRYFENAAETNSKARVGFFDVSGNCWNLYLDRVKETKDRGTLVSRLIDMEAQFVGFTTLIESEDREGLFIFENGNMRRVVMNRYMTKTRATRINTKTPDTPMKAYFDIPEGMNIVTIDDKDIPLSRIPLQSYTGTGKQFLESKEEPYDVTFKQGEVELEEAPLDKDVFNGVATFSEDGTLTFDWKSLNTTNREGIFSAAYQELIGLTLLFVHDDGTAKRVKGELFTVKSRRSQIRGNKDGTKTIAIIPLPENTECYLVGSYENGFRKCVAVSGISYQGITGGGIRVLWTQKHKLESVVCVDKAPIPVVSFAVQPKQYEEAVPESSEEMSRPLYITMNTEGYSCAGCGDTVHADDPVMVCDVCGGVFCRKCVENGTYEEHECEMEDEEE